MLSKQQFDIPDVDALRELAGQLAAAIAQGKWVFLEGDLGAGKTTFSKAFIKHKGSNELVTSPTYALMQDYQTPTGTVIHCDLYRLGEPEELFEIGLLELAEDSEAVVLIEWADKGLGVLPQPDYVLRFDFKDKSSQQRRLTLTEYKR